MHPLACWAIGHLHVAAQSVGYPYKGCFCIGIASLYEEWGIGEPGSVAVAEALEWVQDASGYMLGL